MILRIVRGRARPAERAWVAAALGLGTGRPGAICFHAGVRPAGEWLDIVTVGCWPAARLAELTAADPVEGRYGPGGGPADWPVEVLDRAHFEVDKPILRPGSGGADALAIRVATARFSRTGSDIEMQELLRHRAPEIGDDMTEAYVGRRIAGRNVEVVFVSVWSRVPTDPRLDEIFWPEIALAYDEFFIDVYSALSLAPA